MEFLIRDGVRLSYADTKQDLPAIVLVHGCGCDHRFLAPQVEYFRESHRVISVDLRGHGESDAPRQDYTMAVFADDLSWLCNELSVKTPVMVGHSMGGNVILEVAARFPHIPSSLVMIDSTMFAPQAMLDATLAQLIDALQGPGYLEAYKSALMEMCMPAEDRSAAMVSSLRVPQHVLASALTNHTIKYDASDAARACRQPIAYILSIMPLLDLDRFKALRPQLVVGRTIGSGHFSPLEVPDQINSMISRFIRSV
jgi:pimeloyl-ACP methyl ester carboxylesterase